MMLDTSANTASAASWSSRCTRHSSTFRSGPVTFIARPVNQVATAARLGPIAADKGIAPSSKNVLPSPAKSIIVTAP